MAGVNLLYVLREIATDYLAKGKIRPTDFIGSVARIITESDKSYSNKDPFYDQEIDEQRIFKGGHIKDGKKAKIAHIQIPDFFSAPELTLKSTQDKKPFNEINSLTLLKVNVTEVKNIQRGDGVVVSFKDPGKYEKPHITKRIPEKDVMEYRVRIPKEKNKLIKKKKECGYGDFIKIFYKNKKKDFLSDWDKQTTEVWEDTKASGAEAKEKTYDEFKRKFWG